jgi:archaellum component FlaF (FlaF/FlaG flagellin family)
MLRDSWLIEAYCAKIKTPFMKLLIRILPVLLIAFMINCSKSGDAAISIAGTWTGVSIATTGCTSSSNNFSTTYACPATSNNSCIRITFTSNGSFSTEFSAIVNGTATSGTNSGTYSIKGNSIAITTSSSGQTSTETDTFTVSGSLLTITSPKNSSSGCANVIILTK